MGRFPTEAPGARLPMLFRHLALNLAIGAAFGVAFTAFLISADIAGLGELIAGSGDPLLAVVMLGFMNVLTFGSLAMGTGVMALPRERWSPAASDEDEGSAPPH